MSLSLIDPTLGIIILANVAVVFAFLAGATTDISSLLGRSERKYKLFAALATITLCLLVLVVLRNPN